MQKIFFVLIILVQAVNSMGQIAISNTNAQPHPSSQLDVTATDKGVLLPRMNTATRTTISNPANGLLVYDTDTKSQWFYSGQFTRWLQIIDSTKDAWALYVDVIHNKVNGQIGIGTSTPVGTVNLFTTTNPSLRFTNALSGNSSTNGTELKLAIDEFAIKNYEAGNTRFITDGATRMMINGATGFVSVGSSAATSPLSFEKVTGEKINLANVDAAASFGIGVAPANLQFHVGTGSSDIQFGIGKSGTSFTNLLTIENNADFVLTNNRLTRTSVTGNASVLPVAYGQVAANGTLVNSGTGNYTLTRFGTGQYRLTINDPDFVTNPSLFSVIVQPLNFTPAYQGGTNNTGESTVYHNMNFSGANINIRFYEYVVGLVYIDPCISGQNCVGQIPRQVLNDYIVTDCGFNFWVYKAG